MQNIAKYHFQTEGDKISYIKSSDLKKKSNISKTIVCSDFAHYCRSESNNTIFIDFLLFFMLNKDSP